jgi:hypothetical protein
MPVLLIGRAKQDVSRLKFDDRLTFDLRPAHALGHNQGLAERVRVPRGSGARFELDDRAGDARRLGSMPSSRQ